MSKLVKIALLRAFHGDPTLKCALDGTELVSLLYAWLWAGYKLGRRDAESAQLEGLLK